MNTALFYYDGFAEFEIALTLLLLTDHDWHHLALEARPFNSLEGQTLLVSKTLSSVDPKTLDLIVIPGGDSSPLMANDGLRDFFQTTLKAGGIVAGICGGAELLAGLGMLEGLACTGGTSGISESDALWPLFKNTQLLDQSVVVSPSGQGLVVTAQGQAFLAFAAKLESLMNEKNSKSKGLVSQDLAVSEAATLRWLMNHRDV